MSGSAGVFAYGADTDREFESKDWPWGLEYIGVNVYEGTPKKGHGQWESAAGKVALDGSLQTIWFKVPFSHRPVRLLLYHIDDQAEPSPAALSYWLDYEGKDSYSAVAVWHSYTDGVSTSVSHLEEFGETWETLPGQYRLMLQGTSGHFVFPTLRVQKLKGDTARTQEGQI